MPRMPSLMMMVPYFSNVLTYLRDGRVDLPRTIRKKALVKELLYYGISPIDESTIDDEDGSVKAGYNVNFMWEEAILHSVLSKIIIYFLSFNTSSTFFSSFVHKKDDHRFINSYKNKRSSIRPLWNGWIGDCGNYQEGYWRRRVSWDQNVSLWKVFIEGYYLQWIENAIK